MKQKVEEQRETKNYILAAREGNKIQNEEILEINKQGRYNKEDFEMLEEQHKFSLSKEIRRISNASSLATKSNVDQNLQSTHTKRMTLQFNTNSMMNSVFNAYPVGRAGRGRTGSLFAGHALMESAKSK